MVKFPPWQHIVLMVCISLVITGGFAYYHHTKISALEEAQRAQLESVANLLTTKISEVDSSVTSLNTELQDETQALRGYVDKLDLMRQLEVKSLQKDFTDSKAQTAEQLAGLLGELNTVKATNEEQLAELEDKIVSIKSSNSDFSAVLDDVLAAVVRVSTNSGSGSGVIFEERGYIMTNYHVIEGASALGVVTNDGELHFTRVVGYNPVADLAVLKIEGSFDELRFSDIDQVQVGDSVIAVGNPAGLDFSVTEGIISSVNRLGPNNVPYIQTDVAINPGNSGGPIVNTKGRIVGIATSKLEGFEGLGFAVPTNIAEDFGRQAIDHDTAQ